MSSTMHRQLRFQPLAWTVFILGVLLAAGAGGTSPSADSASEDPLGEAKALLAAGRMDEAKSAALPFQTRASGAYLLGQVALEEGDPAEACRWLDRAVELGPEDPELRFWAGRAYGARAQEETSRLRQASAARRARTLFEEALRLDPEHLGARLALVRFHLSAPALVGGNRAEARRQAEDLARRNAPAGFLAWAAIYEKEEKWTEAAAAYRSAIKSGPGEEEPYLRLIWLHQRRKSFANALQVADQLLKAIPGSILGLYEVGRTAAFSGLRLEEGKAALARYLELRPRPMEPSLALAHFHLGMIHRHEGRNDLAGTQFRRALTLDSELEDARRNLAEVGG